MSGKVFVTGIGVISAIGNNVEETINSINHKKSGIGKINHLDTVHKDNLVAGEVNYSNEELSKMLGIEEDNYYPRTALLGMIAAREAYESANVDNADKLKTGIVSGTTIGGMDKTEKFYRNAEDNYHYLISHNCGFHTEVIANDLGIKDYVTTISTACSSAANAIIHGAKLIKHHSFDRVIAGGTDCLTKFTLNGFNTLMIIDPDPCKPFDKDRKGLNLGEGAAFIVLESENAVAKNNKTPIAEITGYANSNDAYHQTASSPEGNGPYLCMKDALQEAKLKPSEIDHIIVHGTGTDNNDITEGRALKKIFGDNVPPFCSNKSFTGHTLGAAGGINAIFSLISIRENIISPNLNFKKPIEELNLSPITDLKRDIKVNHVLSNSFGFGGNDSSLIFSTIK